MVVGTGLSHGQWAVQYRRWRRGRANREQEGKGDGQEYGGARPVGQGGQPGCLGQQGQAGPLGE